MNIMQVAGFAAASAVLTLVVRRLRPEIGAVLAVSAGIALVFLAVPSIAQIIDGISAFGAQGQLTSGMVSTLLKITGVSLLADFAARTCSDAGESGIARHVEFAGRVMILALALPSMQSLMQLILSLSV